MRGQILFKLERFFSEKQIMRFFILAAGFILTTQMASAQMDLSSELLLKPSAQPPETSGLESGRYKVKKNAQSPASADEMTIKLKKVKSLPGKKVSGSEVSLDKDMGKNTLVVVPPTTSSTTTTTTTSSTTSTLKTVAKPESEMSKILFSQPAPEKPVVAKPVDKGESETSVAVDVPAPVEPSVTDQVRDLVMGNGSQEVEAYKEQVHPDDIRINRIEVNIMPGLISNQSKSNYSFRNYNTFSPKISLGASFWLTPFMGLYGDYTTSMGSDVVSDGGVGSRISAVQEWTELGFDIRKFFGMSRKANSLQFGIHMSEYKFTVPGDDTHRVNLRSSGIGLHLLTRIPVAPSYSWVFGGKLIPRVQHSEIGTGVDLSSGQTGESTRVDLMVGGEFKLARQNQIVWNLTSSFEKNQFNGQANITDPERGVAPKGVSVENTFVIFSLGYRWGQ